MVKVVICDVTWWKLIICLHVPPQIKLQWNINLQIDALLKFVDFLFKFLSVLCSEMWSWCSGRGRLVKRPVYNIDDRKLKLWWCVRFWRIHGSEPVEFRLVTLACRKLWVTIPYLSKEFAGILKFLDISIHLFCKFTRVFS